MEKALCLDSKWGLIDTYGDIAVKSGFSELLPFRQGLAAAKMDDEYGFINKGGEFVIDPELVPQLAIKALVISILPRRPRR